MKLYKLVIRDNIPEMVQIPAYGTITMPDGKLYWVIPVETESTPTTLIEPTTTPQESQERVITLLKNGVKPISEIARRVGLTQYTVTQIIRAAGLKTPSEILHDKIEEILRSAGAIGVTTYEIGKLTSSSHQIGPIMRAMLRRGEAKRLNNGNYATFEKGNP